MHAKDDVDATLHEQHDHEVRAVIAVGDDDIARTQLFEQLAEQGRLAGLFAGIASTSGTHDGRCRQA